MTRCRRLSRRGAVWIAGLAAAVVLDGARDAVATTCVPTPLADVANQAAAIFEASVSAVTAHPLPTTRSADGTVSFVAASRVATALVTDVTSIRGATPVSVESIERVLEAGRRYLILAMEYPQRPGVLVAGGCSGYVRPADRADAFKAWLESLGRPSTGGRIIGSVVARGAGSDVSAWPPVAGARVVARGPITRETTAIADGQFAIADLPEGEYEVSVTLPDGRHGLRAPKPATARLTGAHAVWNWDFGADVDGVVTGVVVDADGRPVGSAPIYLHAGPRAGDAADHPYWIGRSAADGRYEFRGVPPGYYVVTLDEPFVPALAHTLDGAGEFVVGYAERLELAPVVATRGSTIQVAGLVVDAGGQPVESEFRVEVLGPLGPYPKSGSSEASDASGRFSLRLLRGFRYRFTTTDESGTRRATTDVVADGSPVRLVRP